MDADEPWEWDGCCSDCGESLTWNEGEDSPDSEDEALCYDCEIHALKDRAEQAESALTASRRENRILTVKLRVAEAEKKAGEEWRVHGPWHGWDIDQMPSVAEAQRALSAAREALRVAEEAP